MAAFKRFHAIFMVTRETVIYCATCGMEIKEVGEHKGHEIKSGTRYLSE